MREGVVGNRIFSEEQLASSLYKAGKAPVANSPSATARASKRSISEQTIYHWRLRFSAMNDGDVKCLLSFDHKNIKLNKTLSNRGLCAFFYFPLDIAVHITSLIPLWPRLGAMK